MQHTRISPGTCKEKMPPTHVRNPSQEPFLSDANQSNESHKAQAVRLSPILTTTKSAVCHEHQFQPRCGTVGGGRSRTPGHQSLHGRPERNYKVPQGVKTLAQWGQTMIPSSKKVGKTFQQVFEEHDGYLVQIRNRKAISPWLRNLQN